jgi:uncharacterized protein (TIGR03437 family)
LFIESTSPGLFSANSDGRGVAAAVALRLGADGSRTALPVFRCEARPGSCVPVPIDLGGPTDQVILELFGTGIRGTGDAAAVDVLVGSVKAEMLYAGPQNEYAGLDQVNIRVPRSLIGRGQVDILLSVDGRLGNPVGVVIQ